MKFFAKFSLLCLSVLAVCLLAQSKPQPQITGEDLSSEEEKRSSAPSDGDEEGVRGDRNNNDADERPETPRGQMSEVSGKRKDNIEDVILKELDDLKFSYTKGKKGGRGKDAKTEVLASTGETQGVKESTTKLDMPDLEEAKMSNMVKVKGDAGKKATGKESDDNDDDMKLHIPALTSRLEGLLNSHEKSKFIENKKNSGGGKHKNVKKKSKGEGGDAKGEDGAFNTHDNMETTVTPEAVSNDVMIRRMKNIKTMKHGIPDLENAKNKKDKKKVVAVKQTKGKEGKDFKLNNALLGDVSHDEKKPVAETTSADNEGSGAKESEEIPEVVEGKHIKGKGEAPAETKSNNSNINDGEGDLKEDVEKPEFATEKISDKEAPKVTKGKEKTADLGDSNTDKNNAGKEEDREKSEKVAKSIPEDMPKKKAAPVMKKPKNSSEALESGMESGNSEITNKSASDIKYNLNLENVKLKDVNLKIPDLENSKLGRMIGSKSVKVNVSVDVVKLEGMQIKVPESASSAVPVKNQSLVFNELQEYKNSKKDTDKESVVDDVRQADFRAIEDVKNVGGNVAGAPPSKVSIPESEILKFADKNKDVSVKGITINSFKDLQAMPNKAANELEKKKKKAEKDPKKLVEKLEKVKFDKNEKESEESKQVESGSFGNKEKSIRIKSIKIKGLNNLKLGDLKPQKKESKGAKNVQNPKASATIKGEKEMKIKGVRVKAMSGLHLKDMKLGDDGVPVATNTKKEHGDKKKPAQQFNGMLAGDENKEEDVKSSAKSSEPESAEKSPSHDKPAAAGKVKPGKKVKTEDLHVATGPSDDDVHVKSSSDKPKTDMNESTEKMEDGIEEKASKSPHEEKRKGKKSSEKKEAKEVAGHNSKEAQKPEKVTKGVHLTEEKEGKKEDIHVEGVSRVKAAQDDIKLDEEKPSEDKKMADAKEDEDKKRESDASARSSEEEYEKAFKTNMDKQNKELNPDADEQNIENILHFKNSNEDEFNSKGFKLNNRVDEDKTTDDLLGESSPLFHDSSISGVSDGNLKGGAHHDDDSSEDLGVDMKRGDVAGSIDVAKRHSIPSSSAVKAQKRYVLYSR